MLAASALTTDRSMNPGGSKAHRERTANASNPSPEDSCDAPSGLAMLRNRGAPRRKRLPRVSLRSARAPLMCAIFGLTVKAPLPKRQPAWPTDIKVDALQTIVRGPSCWSGREAAAGHVPRSKWRRLKRRRKGPRRSGLASPSNTCRTLERRAGGGNRQGGVGIIADSQFP